MELLFVVVIAAGIGLLVRTLVRGNDTYGAALIPSVSAAIAAVVWVFLLWVPRFTFDGGWIWVISLVLAAAASLALAIVLPRNRAAADRALLTKLSGGKA
jgi:hypothetical protein